MRILFTALAVSASCGVGAATDPIEEIVVYGELRSTTLDTTPSSISVVTAETIERRAAQHLEQILATTANVNFASGASRGRYLQIRGIGETGQFIEPLNSSVGLLIDHVDFSGMAAVTTLYDADQVEIFRGPQGTLYGANALAGLVNVTTTAPGDTPAGSVDLEAADYGTYSAGVRASAPLSDTVAGRIALQQYRSDGYVDNQNLGQDDTNDFDELTMRGKLRFMPNPQSTIDLTVGYVDVDNGYDAFSLDNVRDTLSDQPGQDAQESKFGSVHASFTQASAFKVEVTGAHATSDVAYGYDEDWVYVGFDPNEYSSTDLYLRDRDTTTGEVRFVSKDAGRLFGDSTDWAFGLYVLGQEESLDRRYTYFVDDFRSRFEIDRYAVFGQTETFFGDANTFTFGARYERHESSYRDNEGVAVDPSDDLWGGRVAIDRLIGNDTLVYASLARGYKAGGFNTDGTLPEDLREFDPETLYNLEFGLKGSWREDTVIARLALFYMWRDDMQVSTSIVRVRPDGSSEFIEFTGNASEGRNYGAELEFSWQATDALELFGSVGLLRSEYENFVNAAGRDLDGRDQTHAPRYQGWVGAEYAWPSGFFVRAELETKDEFYFSDSDDERSKAYELMHLTAGYESEHWNVSAWARNVTDEDYYVRGYFFGNDPRIDYEGRGYTQLGEPRRIGATVRWKF